MARRGWVLVVLLAGCEVTLPTKVETGLLDEADVDVDADADADTDADTDTDADADTDTGGEVIPGLTTIYDIQRDYIPIGSEVTVEGVVTAIAFNGIYLQDPGGGARSGIWVFTDADWAVVYTPALLGDRMRARGEYVEFLEMSQISLPDSLSPNLVNLGPAELPAPEVLRVSELGEDWEGVLVRVEDVDVANPDIGFGEFSVVDREGNVAIVDNQIHWFEPAAAGTLSVGEPLLAVTGPLYYSFGAFKIEPRGEEDLLLPGEETGGTGDTGTPIEETGESTGDTGTPIEETGEGTGDTGTPIEETGESTGDTGAPVEETSDTGVSPPTGDTGQPLPETSIEDLNQGLVAVDTEVFVADAVVSAVGPQGLFAQSSSGGPYSGLYVSLGDDYTSLWGPVAVGDLIHVQGIYREYFDQTEVDLTSALTPSLSVISSGPPPQPYVGATATFGSAATGEPWENVLVEVRGVSVEDPALPFNEFSVIDGSPTTAVVIDDLLYLYPGYAGLSVGSTFSAIRGPLQQAFGTYKLLPRDVSDLVP